MSYQRPAVLPKGSEYPEQCSRCGATELCGCTRLVSTAEREARMSDADRRRRDEWVHGTNTEELTA
ncbi:hypothetical protein [Rhodococcus koreensis]